jgi:LDH2 family malate/lactate/ureidoglycolate dehydrogenase
VWWPWAVLQWSVTRTRGGGSLTRLRWFQELNGLVLRALLNLGYSQSDAEIMTKNLMHAEIHGNNQGISKLYRPQDMGFNPDAGPLKYENETSRSVVINGNRRSGMVALDKGVEKAIEKAKSGGVAVVGTYNTCTSTGMLAYYAGRIAEAGLIAFVMAGSPEMVTPVGGKNAIFGTNPLCIAIPGPADGPVILDMATAATTLFGTISTKAAGKQLPPGVAVDAAGKPTTDPDAALKGAFLAFGSYKGAGLSLKLQYHPHYARVRIPCSHALHCHGPAQAIPAAGEAHVGSGRKVTRHSLSVTLLSTKCYSTHTTRH